MKNFIFMLTILLAFSACQNESSITEEVKKQGDYLGEKLPLNTPKLFAPGFVSTGLYTRDITFSPDGDEVFFSCFANRRAFIMETHIENGYWTTPKIAQFSGSDKWLDFEPHISPDGKHFYMLSTRPPEGKEPKPGWSYQNIWTMDKMETGWSEPYNVGEPICTESYEFYATSALDGTLYFTRTTDTTNAYIWRSKKVDGSFTNPEKLIFNNDTTLNMYNSIIAPDESYLISVVENIVDSINIPQYYISFRNEKDEWSELIAFDENINYSGDKASSVYITSNMDYMFFASSRQETNKNIIAPGVSINSIIDNLTSPQNGQADIYWVSTDIINALKP
jgi:WD40-like Beta Propeller Repeat